MKFGNPKLVQYSRPVQKKKEICDWESNDYNLVEETCKCQWFVSHNSFLQYQQVPLWLHQKWWSQCWRSWPQMDSQRPLETPESKQHWHHHSNAGTVGTGQCKIMVSDHWTKFDIQMCLFF